MYQTRGHLLFYDFSFINLIILPRICWNIKKLQFDKANRSTNNKTISNRHGVNLFILFQSSLFLFIFIDPKWLHWPILDFSMWEGLLTSTWCPLITKVTLHFVMLVTLWESTSSSHLAPAHQLAAACSRIYPIFLLCRNPIHVKGRVLTRAILKKTRPCQVFLFRALKKKDHIYLFFGLKKKQQKTKTITRVFTQEFLK